MNRFWLLITWLFITPVFFFISKKYGMKTWERWVLTVLSPLGLLVCLIFFILLVAYLNSRPLDFEDVKFNTPEKVAEELGDNGRILVRESGTEPVIRVMVEAETDELCAKYVKQVIDVICAEGLIVID